MRFFGLKACDTCRKAIKMLTAEGLEFTVVDVRADGVSALDQTQIISEFGDAAINRASTTWRNLDDAEKAKPIAELLRAHPTLMKRPVIEKDGVWTIGWKADVQSQILGETD